MAVNEQIVTGRKFRKLVDEASKLWQRISFWTKASDVEFDDGNNLEEKFDALNRTVKQFEELIEKRLGGLSFVAMSQDEYDTLDPEQKQKNTVYFTTEESEVE